MQIDTAWPHLALLSRTCGSENDIKEKKTSMRVGAKNQSTVDGEA